MINKKNQKAEHKLNSEITAPEVRLGEHGIISIREAMKIADNEGLDLVLISESSNPPVCKLMDYEKFIYEKNKKPKNKSLEMKEIKLGPNMSANDLNYRTTHIIDFLKKGHRIKLSMQFRGRQLAFISLGEEIMLKLIVDIEDFGSAENVPKMDGKKLLAFIKPKPKK